MAWLVRREAVKPVEYQHVPGGGQPVEIGEAVVDRVPVAPEVVREAQDVGELFEESGARTGLSAIENRDGERWWKCAMAHNSFTLRRVDQVDARRATI